jgi:hypothetical protein
VDLKYLIVILIPGFQRDGSLNIDDAMDADIGIAISSLNS